ncbi:hypothetical protein E2P81_ATG03036 [Venturia nashicola]|uniref:Uncharacterized protein n=1 Tax=Venturia nashicola TaxID=86259 RepID=A0A4Z1PMK4_9PEZI|nr:hypothetical protein E6O75_ATG03100 [Venturia nashicola]TLD36147.1 hypothetical protein E2P81_ATG03036 [Venturia nashicola]
MNEKLNGALKSSDLDVHNDAPVMRKRKPSSDKSAFSTLFSMTSRYDDASSSSSPPTLSSLQAPHLPNPISTRKPSLDFTEPLPTMNMVGDIDGRMHALQVPNIPNALGNTMAPLNVSKMFENKLAPQDITNALGNTLAPLNVSKMFENKLSPQDISTIVSEKLALPDIWGNLGTNTVSVEVPTLPNISPLSLRISQIFGIPVGLSNAIVQRLPLIVTNILASKLLPALPDTRPDDVRRLFLKDALPSANVAKLFENNPSVWLDAKQEPTKVWQTVSQIGPTFDNPTISLRLPLLKLPFPKLPLLKLPSLNIPSLNVPPWLLVPLMPAFPILGPLLLLWYTVYAAIFKCPSSSSGINDDTPRICKPYLLLREIATPHVEPYYDIFLKPYVEQARPHVERYNKKYYAPAANFAKHNYDIYGAPRVAHLHSYTDAAWKTNVKPRLEIRRQWATQQYEKNLAPHVQQAVTVTNPYITSTTSKVAKVYESTFVPTVKRVVLHLHGVYVKGHYVASETVLPHLYAGRQKILDFVDRSVWPQLVVLYGENVEPQLTKISERLGRYKDSKKLQAAVSEADSSSKTTSASSTATSAVNQSTPAPVVEEKVDTREKIQSDLKLWQQKLSKAADKGAEDLQGRIEEITSRQIDNQAHGVGEALVVQLEEMVKSSTTSLLEKINAAVKSLPEDADEEDENVAYESILSTIRSTGRTVRDKAQAVRTWKQHYDHDTTALVEAALESTLRVIDNIRDLGLQEIGMRWAGMEGVTYKDWSKYHDLKSTFDEWRSGVEAAARKHKGLTKAQEEGEIVQETAMDAAEKAAKELTRLKDVARWKIDARDSSPDFSTRFMPAKAKKVVDNIKDTVSSASEAVGSSVSAALSSSQGTIESIGSVAASQASGISNMVKSQADSVISAASIKNEETSSPIVGTPAPASEPVLSDVSSDIEPDSSVAASQPSAASRKVFGGAMAANVEAKQIVLDDEFVDEDTVPDNAQSVISVAGDKAAGLTDAISEALHLKPTQTQGNVESLASQASAQYEQAVNIAKEQYTKASLAIVGTPKPAYEEAMSSLQSAYSGTLSDASVKLQSALGHTASLTNMWAKSTPGVYESIASAASSRLQAALSQASAQYDNAKMAVGAQPTPVHQQYLAEAQKQYYQGVGLAYDQYSRFLGAASTAVLGTPTPVYESLLSGAQAQYTSASVAASSKYAELLSQASSLAGQTSKSPAELSYESASAHYDTVLSKASKAFADASSVIKDGNFGQHKFEYLLSAAAEQYSSGSSSAIAKLDKLRSEATAGITSKSGPELALETAASQYSAALSAASQGLLAASASASSVLYGTSTGNAEYLASAASEQLYGTETPWTEAAASQASANWEAIVSRASEQIYGEPTPWHESVLSQAGGYAAKATDTAGSQYAAVQALFSELVVGKEPDFTESVMNRLASAYYTGLPDYASSASSIAGDAYASASSVVTSVFTPPPTLEAILGSANEQLNAAVDAASIQIYGSEPGVMERASSVAAGAYSTVQAKASEVVYGKQPSYAEDAQASIADVAASAHSAISVAIYGKPTGTVGAAGSSAVSAFSNAGNAVKDTYATASAKVSEAIYGAEQGAMESAASRISIAVESARARLSEGTGQAVENLRILSKSVESVASGVGSMASEATDRIKDEL